MGRQDRLDLKVAWGGQGDPPVGCLVVGKKYDQFVQELIVDRSRLHFVVA